MSILKVDKLHSEDGANSNIELDDSRNTTCKGNLTVDGNIAVTGTGLTDTKPFRNILINGAMRVNQRGTLANAGNEYGGPDRWYFFKNDGAMTVSQDADVPTGQGFASSYKIDVTSAASTSGSYYVGIQQKIEGQELQHIKKGSSNAQSLTLSFWVKSTKTGTYIAELDDWDNTRSCSKSYTVNTTNTWEKKTVTFPADTTGAFGNDNDASLVMSLWCFAGSNFQGGTLATTWASKTNANRAEGQVNACDNAANNIYFTGIQLELGDTATDYEHRSYADELLRCQRYCWVQGEGTWATLAQGTIASSTTWEGQARMPVTMRSKPSATVSGNTRVWDAGGATAASATGVDSGASTKDQIWHTATCSGASFTTGRSSLWGANNDATAKVTYEAEI